MWPGARLELETMQTPTSKQDVKVQTVKMIRLIQVLGVPIPSI